MGNLWIAQHVNTFIWAANYFQTFILLWIMSLRQHASRPALFVEAVGAARSPGWQLMILQTTDASTLSQATYYIDISRKSCHITSTVCVYDLTFESGGENVGDGASGMKAAKPVTTVQDCVSTFLHVKHCAQYFRRNQAMFVSTKTGVFDAELGHLYCDRKLVIFMRLQDISSRVCANQSRHCKPKHSVFLTLTKWWLCRA